MTGPADPWPVEGEPAAVRRRVLVSGRVQGVGYRYNCQRVANRLELDGWVRNRADGTVELVVEGERDDVGEFLSWCREGPRHAIVTEVEIIDEVVAGEGPFRVVD